MKKLALFDLDGTITKKDTLLEFIKFTHGKAGFYLGLIILSPVLILYKLKLIANWKAKEMMLGYFYKGWPKSKLSDSGNRFALEALPKLILNSALQKIEEHKINNDEIYIVSASCDIWLKAWCDRESLKLISTEMEFKEGVFTGKFCTLNCHGEEKVNRIRKSILLDNYGYVYAYGNEASDLPMLALANEKFYCHFS